MTITYFFPDSLYSTDFIQDLESIFNDSEGFFPTDQLQVFIKNNIISLDVFSADLVRYAVYRGTEIDSQKEFFSFLASEISNPIPEIPFWRAYDALVRGHLTVFKKLWNDYESIELKNYNTKFISEALVIPEDPIFLNVEPLVHGHQQRLVKHFVLSKETSKDLTDKEYDALLLNSLETFSLLLSFFRLFQATFVRAITFLDLDNLLALVTEDNLDSLGPYWETRFLSAICYWKTSLGLVFDVVDNLTRLKNLNSEASNFLVESQIFHIEALIAFKNNSSDSAELLQSAYFLATEYHFTYQTLEVLFSKLELFPDDTIKTAEMIFSITNENDYPLIKARVYAILGAYYIQQKNWSEAEKHLLQSSKLVQGSYDKKTYYQVIADFSYVLVITRQLQDALESSIILLDDNVSILYRIRGFYLYGLTLLLLEQKTEAIEILEEGIRVALTHKEHISLPWFYELLEVIYLSLNDFENASRYSNLTYKAYFDSSNSEGGYREKIASSYILALEKDYGRAVNQISGLLHELSSIELQSEAYSALQSFLLSSKENIQGEKFVERWSTIDSQESSSELGTLIDFKNSILLQKNSELEFNTKIVDNNFESFKNKFISLEFKLLQQIYQNNKNTSDTILKSTLAQMEQSFSFLKVKFIIFDHVMNYITNLLSDLQNSSQNTGNVSKDDEVTIFSAIFLIALIRNLVNNLPFNFLM